MIKQMKYIIMAFTLISGYPYSFCQILNKIDIRPQIGEKYARHHVDMPDSIHPGPSGTGVVWDLSNINYSLQNDDSIHILDISATPHPPTGTSYAIMDYPVIDVSQINYAYYRDTVNGFYMLNYDGNIVGLKYHNPEFVFKFPLNPGDSMLDNFCFSSTAFSVTYQYCGTAKLKYDGTGTLWISGIPAINNVSRLKYENMQIRQSPHDTSYTLKYFWYKKGIHHPLMEYTAYTDATGISYYNAVVYDAINTTETVTQKTDMHLQVFPNSSDAYLQLQSTQIINGLILTDIMGETIWTSDEINSFSYVLDTRSFGNGIYFLQVNGSQNKQLRKIVVLHE
jgi:hypothetical protein